MQLIRKYDLGFQLKISTNDQCKIDDFTTRLIFDKIHDGSQIANPITVIFEKIIDIGEDGSLKVGAYSISCAVNSLDG